MVNSMVISEYSGGPVPGDRVKIGVVPLYPLDRVRALAKDPHQYIDSEWCTNGFGVWAACDAYEVQRREWVKTANKEMNMVYFVKFAIGKTGALVLVVSCHV